MAAFDTTPGSCYGGPAVAAFTPICSFDPLTPTTPATFDVPAPHIVLPLPPQECVCFDFTPGTANASTTPSCVNQATASVSVAITPDTDCCSGKYVVTPSVDLNVPCMPFRISTNAPIVHNRSHDEDSASGHGTDGGVESFYVRKGTGDNCCTLESGLVLTLPDCVKYHPTLENSPQVTFCERTSRGTVATRTVSNFITLHDDPEHCTFYPEVNELVLPCCSLADLHLGNRIYLEGERTDGRQRDYIDWSYDRVNCETSLSFTPNISCKCFSFAGTNGAAKATAEALPSSDVEKAKVSVTIAQKAGTTCCDGAFVITPEIEIPACPFPDVPPETHRVQLGNGGYADITLSTTDCTPEFSVDSHPVDCPFPNIEIERYAGIGEGGQVKLVAKRTNCNWDFQLSATPISINIPDPPCFSVDTTAVALNIKYKDSAGEPKTATTNLQFANKGVVNGCETFQLGTIADIDLTDIGGGGGIGGGGDCFQPTGDDDVYIDGDTKQDKTWYGGGMGDRRYDVLNAVYCRGWRMRGEANEPSVDDYTPIPYATPATLLISSGTWNVPTENATSTAVNATSTKWASARAIESGSGDNVTVSRGPKNDYASGNLSMVMPTGFQWDTRGIAVTLNEFMYNSSGVLSYVEESQTAPVLAPGLSVKLETSGGRLVETNKNASGLGVVADPSMASYMSNGLSVKAGDGLRIYGLGDGSYTNDDTYTDATTQAGRQGALEIHYGAGFRIIETPAGQNTEPVYHSKPSGTAGAIEVNYGKGLRMVKTPASGNTATTYETAPAEMAGAIEVQYGPGFRAIKDKNGSTDATKYVSNPSTENNAIVPFDGRGLCVKGVTKTNSSATVSEQDNAMEIYKNPVDFEFKANGQLSLNDKKTTNETNMATNGQMGSFIRGGANEVVVPIVVGDVFDPWFVRTTSGAWRPNIDYFMSDEAAESGDDIWSLMSSFYVMYLHVTRSGLVLSIDANNSSAGITRLSDAAS